MYIQDGICYAGELNPSIEVVSVQLMHDMVLKLYFSNGEVRFFDANILTEPVFEPLRDPKVFADVRVECGAPSWLNGAIDVAPEYVYQHSVAENCLIASEKTAVYETRK